MGQECRITYSLGFRSSSSFTHSSCMGSMSMASTKAHHSEQSSACLAIFCQSDLDWCSSWSTDGFQASLGRPCFLLPCGFQNSACLVTQSWVFLSVCLIHLHFFLHIWVAILSWLVISHRSSLPITKGHLIHRMKRRHLLTNTWTLPVIRLLTLQVSAPPSKTALMNITIENSWLFRCKMQKEAHLLNKSFYINYHW